MVKIVEIFFKYCMLLDNKPKPKPRYKLKSKPKPRYKPKPFIFQCLLPSKYYQDTFDKFKKFPIHFLFSNIYLRRSTWNHRRLKNILIVKLHLDTQFRLPITFIHHFELNNVDLQPFDDSRKWRRAESIGECSRKQT